MTDVCPNCGEALPVALVGHWSARDRIRPDGTVERGKVTVITHVSFRCGNIRRRSEDDPTTDHEPTTEE